MKDLFEEVKTTVGCDYISDLRFEPYNSHAKKLMSVCDIDGLPLHTLSDLASYLYNEKQIFQSMEEAKHFFAKPFQKKTIRWHSVN